MVLTDQEAFQSLKDSIASAENHYLDNDIRFASEMQVMGINIALRKIVPGLGHDERIETLRLLFGRSKGVFASSKDMTAAGAMALRDRLYGPNAYVDGTTKMIPEAVQGIREAYRLASGQIEMKFDI
jgi:hypothetical protein